MARIASKEYNFELFHKEESKEWHPKLNGSRKPSDCTPGSGYKAWWKCKKCNSDYQSPVFRRRSGSGCHYCSGVRINHTNCLSTTHPDLIKEWNYQKNVDLMPQNITRGSDKKAWWICKICGHEWNARIANRAVHSRGCPKCANQYIDDDNSLASLHPGLLKEWDYEKNVLSPNEVSEGSNKKVWWKCKNNHEWKTSINHRAIGRQKCSMCRGMVSEAQIRLYCELKTILPNLEMRQKVENFECDLLEREKNLAIEYDGSYWHKDFVDRDKEKNKILAAAGFKLIRFREPPLFKIEGDDIIAFNEAPVKKNDLDRLVNKLSELKFISVSKAEEYCKREDFIDNSSFRTYVSHLPSPLPENSLAFKFPDIAKDFHIQKNHPLTPLDYLPYSNQKVWWKCESNIKHEWQDTISHRTLEKRGCRFCTSQPKVAWEDYNLLIKHPKVSKEWDYEKNEMIPEKVLPGSAKKYWWKCEKGHKWEAMVSNRTKKEKPRGCPYCANKKVNKENCLETNYPLLATEWNYNLNNDLKPSDVVPGSNIKVWWKCSEGHEWEAVINSRAQGNGCRKCSNQNKECKEVTVKGIKYPSISKAIAAHSISKAKVKSRIARGWNIEEAFELTVRGGN